MSMDLEGHGRTDGVHAYVPDYVEAATDVAEYVRMCKARFPDKKIFIIGHSLGGCLTYLASLELKRTNFEVDGMVLQAPVVKASAASYPSWIVVMAGQVMKHLVPELPFISSLRGHWNSPEVEEKVLQESLQDPLVYQGKMRIGTGFGYKNVFEPASKVEPRLRQIDVPSLLLQHGSRDEILDVTGSEWLFALLDKVEDKTFKTYEACHSIMWEPEKVKTEMFQDMANWIAQRCGVEKGKEKGREPLRRRDLLPNGRPKGRLPNAKRAKAGSAQSRARKKRSKSPASSSGSRSRKGRSRSKGRGKRT